MANPITNIKRKELSAEEKQEQNITEVTQAVSENKEAILKGIDLLAALNESGSLDMTNALIKHRKEALENIITELNRPQYTGALENLSKLVFLIGDLKVEELQHFTGKINQGMAEASAASEGDKTSYMGLIKAMKDPEINRSVTMLLQFLRGMGRE